MATTFERQEFPVQTICTDLTEIGANAKVVSATKPAEVHWAVYENNVWKEIFNNYTKYVSPSDIESNNGIYFVFGNENSLANEYPTVLNAKIQTK